MSALSIIDNYGSSSDESEAEKEDNTRSQPQRKKIKLQLPDLSFVPVLCSESHSDDPKDHDGRVRSFPHVRGNWATFIYVKYPSEENLQQLLKRLLGILSAYQDSCHVCDNFHISLSKTVVLQYHLIIPFTKSLQEVFNSVPCFNLEYLDVKIYCNEDNTRTFIALGVDNSTKKHLLKLSRKVDEVLGDYKLPLFYENPSFHMSILWFNGNKKDELLSYLTELNHCLQEEVGSTVYPALVGEINCKIGNKYFKFELQ